MKPSAKICVFEFFLLLAILLPSASAQVALETNREQFSGKNPASSQLPSPRERTVRFFLTKENVVDFKEQLLAPLASWLENDLFTFRLFRSLDFSWQFNEQWETATKGNYGRYRLAKDFSLEMAEESNPVIGFPFGRAGALAQEPDPVQKAYKILWNMTMAQSIGGNILYDIQLSSLGIQTAIRQSEGYYYRQVFPPAHTDMISRELLRLSSPAVVLGFSEVSWRFFDAREDSLWIHSPVIGKTRKVYAANRSDPLLGGLLSMDDIFGWSTKIQAVNAKVVAEKTLLAPVPALAFYLADFESWNGAGIVSTETDAKAPSSPEKGKSGEKILTIQGYYQRSDSSRTMALWNWESRQFPAQPAWVPVTVVFVPRPVWIIELSPREALYNSGREILAVDKDSMLPIYKLVYNQDGSYQKTVIAGWALASTKDEKVRFPFAAFALAVDYKTKEAMAITTRTVRVIPQDSNQFNSLLEVNEREVGEAKSSSISSSKAKPSASSAAAEEQGPQPED